ncbi:MAG: hypothetical protein IKR48_05745, partial [Kiritimatiellae bacterium]|nr:hypothetical protein [Kiritimatiellia bacterium]
FYRRRATCAWLRASFDDAPTNNFPWILCGAQIPVTLETGVRLPSGTISVVGAIGVTLRALNRVTGQRDYLFSSSTSNGNYSVSLLVWRSIYCDEDGNAQLFLTAEKSDQGTVSFQYEGGAEPYHIVCQSTLAWRGAKVCFEPVSFQTVTEDLYNPPCVILGESATFRIEVSPATFPNTDIVWRGSGMFSFPNGNLGRSVQVAATGTEANWNSLNVSLSGVLGMTDTNRPRLEFVSLPYWDVNAIFWVLSGENNAPLVTQPQIALRMQETNKILKQASVRVSVTDVVYTNVPYIVRTDYSNIVSVVDRIKLEADIPTNTILFVFNPNCKDNGESFKGVVMLREDAGGYTIAHETMHELFDMQDVFPESPEEEGTQIVLEGNMSRSWMKRDWGSNDPAMNYYEETVPQADWIHRLLMYCCDEYSAVGIPRGNIHGIYYKWVNGDKVWYKGPAKVGLLDHLENGNGGNP